jgi:hypothetical protein
MAVGIRCADHAAHSLSAKVVTIFAARSVGIVRWRTKAPTIIKIYLEGLRKINEILSQDN